MVLANSSLGRADSSPDIVNQQLDMVEGSLKAGDAQKEFSDEGEGSLLKTILTPGLQENPSPVRPPSNVNTRMNTFDMGSEVSFYRYQEPQPVGIKIQGPMYGYFADYAYRPADPNFFNNFLTNVYMLQARYASSHDLEYSGDGVIKGKFGQSMEFRGLIGKDYFIGTNSIVTPYFGFGYRYLLDLGNGEINSTGTSYAYDRKSHYCYLPLGGNAVIEMPDNWEVGLNAEYDILLKGWEKSYLSDGDQFTGYNNPNVTSDQAQGFGVRGSIKFLKRGAKVDFYIEPYIRYWNIDQSKIETEMVDGQLLSLAEPDNNTIEVGSKFGIQF
jgi:hypothetical protein